MTTPAARILHMMLCSFDDASEPRKSLTLLFAVVDDAMLDGDWEFVREILRTVRLERHSITVAIGFATATLPGRETIGEARGDYIARLTRWLRMKDPARAEELLRGLK